ncbi:MAG TPA: S8 family peptidase [Casimicrobiaceae bacterium]|jgi:serine protease|nr:S8 family peptidase [Casimicrobiaceae bacterium]
MVQKIFRRLVVVLVFGAIAPGAYAETVSRIRLMLHPYAGAPGQLPMVANARLQTLAGLPLTLARTTRTGGLEFTLAQPLDADAAAALVQRLRNDRSVLWAETISTDSVAKSQALPANANAGPGQKLMVRLAAAASPNWSALLPRWNSLIGTAITVDHQIGDVWVLKLGAPVPDAELANMASQLETDAAVQYADPVRRVRAQRVPNDPDFGRQWALTDPVGGINAPAAWDLQIGSAGVTIAVIDTGITQHPELAGRVLPGYDFISDPSEANDGGGRDSDPSDPGDNTGDNECGPGVPGEPSSWHGTFVSGLIAANTDNGVGIAGVNWNAKILPVRVLGRCGGTFDDIVAGILWAVGAPVAGAPPNPNPARVINLSLGGQSSCPQAMQDAINVALAQGVVVAIAAGNDSIDVSMFAPANCAGVITVGASTRQGDRAGYSNFGIRVDVSAPGGDGNEIDWILSLSNEGTSGPSGPSYAIGIGTSFAAPHVAGVASLMLARNANLTPGQVLGIISETARSFNAAGSCARGPACGGGLLDAGFALLGTVSSSSMAPPGTVPVIEYYRAEKDHYFMTANPAEIASVDTNLPAFQRTGEVFFAWVDPALAPANAVPVCRFFSPLPLIDSHFYSASASECLFVQMHWPGIWGLELTAAFYVILPDAAGNCQAGTQPVYRFFDNRNDANHRYTVDLTVRRAMINRNWVPEGNGPNAVSFCSPV